MTGISPVGLSVPQLAGGLPGMTGITTSNLWSTFFRIAVTIVFLV